MKKLQFKPFVALVLFSAVISVGCSGVKEKGTSADADADPRNTPVNLRGQWYIENIVFSDSDYVRPDETVPGVPQYIVFEDSTYFIMTNCNSISGTYAVKDDSLCMGDGAMTEMACDNMATEDALRRILPEISTVDVQNDSVVRLSGASPAECILLRKAKIQIK